jgi:hypothetical protein
MLQVPRRKYVTDNKVNKEKTSSTDWARLKFFLSSSTILGASASRVLFDRRPG